MADDARRELGAPPIAETPIAEQPLIKVPGKRANIPDPRWDPNLPEVLATQEEADVITAQGPVPDHYVATPQEHATIRAGLARFGAAEPGTPTGMSPRMRDIQAGLRAAGREPDRQTVIKPTTPPPEIADTNAVSAEIGQPKGILSGLRKLLRR